MLKYIIVSSNVPAAVSCGNPADNPADYTHVWTLAGADDITATAYANSDNPKPIREWARNLHGFTTITSKPLSKSAHAALTAPA
jgi:hypothetical protein